MQQGRAGQQEEEEEEETILMEWMASYVLHNLFASSSLPSVEEGIRLRCAGSDYCGERLLYRWQ